MRSVPYFLYRSTELQHELMGYMGKLWKLLYSFLMSLIHTLVGLNGCNLTYENIYSAEEGTDAYNWSEILFIMPILSSISPIKKCSL